MKIFYRFENFQLEKFYLQTVVKHFDEKMLDIKSNSSRDRKRNLPTNLCKIHMLFERNYTQSLLHRKQHKLNQLFVFLYLKSLNLFFPEN